MESERNENKALAQLPFVSGKCFWRVKASGDWLKDSQKGAEYARCYVACTRTTGRGPLLSWIVKDMLKANSWTGIEAAFLASIGQYALGAAHDGLTRDRALLVIREGDRHHADNAKTNGAVVELKGRVVRAKAVRGEQCGRNKLT